MQQLDLEQLLIEFFKDTSLEELADQYCIPEFFLFYLFKNQINTFCCSLPREKFDLYNRIFKEKGDSVMLS